MLKLFILISLIYAILKTVSAPETTIQGYVGFFLSRFLGFFFYILKDVVRMFIPKSEPKRRR